jgi:hypothetical protein
MLFQFREILANAFQQAFDIAPLHPPAAAGSRL